MKQFGIRHKANKTALMRQVVAPPRLSTWTTDINEAQVFEFESEAQAAVEYVTKWAFNTEVFEIKRIENERT